VDDGITKIRRAHQKALDARAKKPKGQSRPFRREWYDRLCSWCGREYNLKDEGGSKSHCSAACAAIAEKVEAEKREKRWQEKHRRATGNTKRRNARKSPETGQG
jgi:CRISPR/Cas system-associated protein Cas10 (large subunit of type III CRISPR-Cas system)